LKKLGLPADVVRKAALVAYESEINIVSYARKEPSICSSPRQIKIEAIDEGRDSDIAMACRKVIRPLLQKSGRWDLVRAWG